jgi:hypothetical protein
MAEGRPAPDEWRTEPALPHRGCPCPAFRRAATGPKPLRGALLLRGGVNAGGDGVHSPRRAVGYPLTGRPARRRHSLWGGGAKAAPAGTGPKEHPPVWGSSGRWRTRRRRSQRTRPASSRSSRSSIPSSGPSSDRISDGRMCAAVSRGQDRTRPIGRPALPDAPSVTLVLPVTTVTVFPFSTVSFCGRQEPIVSQRPEFPVIADYVLFPATTSDRAPLPTCYGFFLDASHICCKSGQKGRIGERHDGHR